MSSASSVCVNHRHTRIKTESIQTESIQTESIQTESIQAED